MEALEDILDAHQLRALIDKGRSILSRARFVEVDILQKKSAVELWQSVNFAVSSHLEMSTGWPQDVLSL